MFINKFEIFYESQNVPHSHFIDMEGKKVDIFLKFYSLKPKSLIYSTLKRGKFQSSVLPKFCENKYFLLFLPFKIMILSN